MRQAAATQSAPVENKEVIETSNEKNHEMQNEENKKEANTDC